MGSRRMGRGGMGRGAVGSWGLFHLSAGFGRCSEGGRVPWQRAPFALIRPLAASDALQPTMYVKSQPRRLPKPSDRVTAARPSHARAN